MISSTADYLLEEVPAADNLNAIAYPWWSVVNNFELPNLTEIPVNRDFFGLGDSFAAGIGASCGDILPDDPSNGTCRKCEGAYPFQLKRDDCHLDDSLFRFYACSGAKTSGIFSPPPAGKHSQVDQIKAARNFDKVGFSTLRIGGNNVGFSKVLKACIFLDLNSCAAERARTEARIASNELQINLTTCTDAADESGHWGEMFTCELAQAYAQHAAQDQSIAGI